ncbi:MAG: hypothetical protein JXA33_00190 [Anaerolineae bacterium]|nr:hypothetical protein [Anaerolineae bacterium]
MDKEEESSLVEGDLMDIYLHEYDRLKEEQIQRIGFRDNMIYVNLTAVGAAAAFAVSDVNHLYVLLVIPWICFVLGWTYLVNDEKISAIGRYVRLTLVDSLSSKLAISENQLFGWEVAHRDDKHRKQRKLFQLFVDEIAFCLSGLVAIGLFWLRLPSAGTMWLIVSIFESVLLIVLAYQMILYADFRRGR